MPVVGKPEFNEEKRASWFAHKGEIATPYYYKVYLAEHDIVTEMAPTERAVLFRFTFPENEHSYIIVDAFDKGSYVKVIPEENKIIGYTTRNSGGVPENFKNYFIIEFDKPFTYKATVANGNLQENVTEQTTDHAGAIIGFRTHKGEQVHARIASSFISFEQAAVNMKELGKDNIEQVAKKGKEAWNQVLGKIEVEGGNLDQYRTFYSCLYRSLLFPRKFYELDANGRPIHYSPYNGQVLPGYMYTDTGFWDTFRCLFPLLNLMYPSVNKEMQEGLINTYKESGFFPEWASPGHRGCMVGNNSASVLVDAYMKGVKVDDIKTLYEGLLHGTENVHSEVSSTGRLGHEYYNKLGYVPYDVKINENAARTLEYAYDDWCIYKLAKELKRTKKEITGREMRLGILIAIFGAVVDFLFFGFSYSADPQGEHGEITTASIVLSVIWIALSLAGAFLMSRFLNDRSFLFGFSGYLILSLVVVYPLLYGYCASLYPAYGLIAEKLFRSETMLENMPDSALIFEPLRIVLVYALYFLGRHLAKKGNA